MYRRIVVLIIFGFLAGEAVAQRSTGATARSISSTETRTGRLYYADRNAPPRAIEFNERTVTASDFITNINQYFGIPAEFTFKETESNTDALGMRHRQLQQYYKGTPVEGMGYRIHEKDGFIRSGNGKAVREIELDTVIRISEKQAFNLALAHIHTKDTVFRPARKLIVSKDFVFSPESFSIAFQFDIDVSLVEHWRISIDAGSGHVINKVNLVNTCGEGVEPQTSYGTGTGITNYYGSRTVRVEKMGVGSRLVGQTESGGIIGTYDFRNVSEVSLLLFFQYHEVYDFYSSTNTYNSDRHKPAVSAQWAAEQAYEYYFKVHNRSSFDNNGAAIKCYVHVGQNMNNALWTHNLLAFGDGSNNNPLVELDVVSHELTHGVTQYEAGLQYYAEPGALNESFSDILGKAVEFYTFGDTASWQMAKHYQDGGLRDLSNPNVKGQADTYLGDLWYTGYEDNGGVHYNSGVQNFWFYLLCEGGSGVNDHEMNYTVTPIGMDAAVSITYRNLTEYLSGYSDYLDCRIGSLLAAADLYGKNSVVYQEVDKAWDAVGVIDEPIIMELQVYDITATTVKIKGSFEPRGDTVSYHFEYGTTPAFGSASSDYEYTGKVEGILTGLRSETKYYLRLVATNENGNSYATAEFTTLSLAPLVKIKETVDVTETTAVLYGEINPNSLPTSYVFEYGPTPDLGLTTPIYTLSDTTEYLKVSAAVSDLQPRQTYYYRLVATNDFTSSSTGSVSFFTAIKPIVSAFSPTTALVGEVITITGQNFNANAEMNFVSFGATRAAVVSSSVTEIKVKVPPGASLGPISVLNAQSGLAAESAQEFVPTFSDGFRKRDLQLRVGINNIGIHNPRVQDIDGDGRPDVIADHNGGFTILQNVNQGGDITDESFLRNTYNFPELTGRGIYVADLDGNGLKELIGHTQSGLRIYPNLSVPGYIFFGTAVDVLSDRYFRQVAFRDFDGDGHVDIAATSNLPDGTSLLTIIRNQNPKGILSPENFELKYEMTLPYYVYDLYNEDLNNDSKPDFIFGTIDKAYVPILKNNSEPGVFVFETIIAEDLSRSRSVEYLLHDLNRDGWKDIASYSPSNDLNLTILQNEGVSSTVGLADPAATLSGYVDSSIQAGDINGDGSVDLLIGLNNGKFLLVRNKALPGERLSASSFEIVETFGSEGNTDSHQASITVSDLNGDGRPELINTNYYNRYPFVGYQMEIWQNAPPDCIDPASIALEISNYTVGITLPPGTTLDQFQIEYRRSGDYNWRTAGSTTLQLWSGSAYQLRARAKCYLGFTDYYYFDFTTDCVNTNNFSVSSVTANGASLSPSNLSAYEVQYSQSGKDGWTTLPQSANQISNLLPGTTYHLRYRGRCSTPAPFKYKEFTTHCPSLSSLDVIGLTYNQAAVQWTSSYAANAIVEYSTDKVKWILIDDSRTMYPLAPATQYFVRGKLACTDVNSDFIYTSFITPCPAVSVLTTDAVTPFSATINWVDESNTGRYTLTYSMVGGGPAITVETRSTSFDLDGLSPGTRYSVAVAPQCIEGKVFTSISFSTVCYVPFDLSATAVTQTSAELSWKDHFNALPYSVDYSILDSESWRTIETAMTKIALPGLRPGTEYEVRVHINCTSETADYVSVRFATELYGSATIVPNPTNNKITIYPSTNLIGRRFRIIDNAGRIVAKGDLLDYTFDLSDLPPGIYTLTIVGHKPFRIVKV